MTTALVTGASSGIGMHTARLLAAEGMTVLAAVRSRPKGEAALAEIGGDSRVLLLDVTDAASVEAAAQQVRDLDVLINNAGISGKGSPAGQADTDEFRQIYETNVFGIVTVTNAFLPALRRSAHPRIVNVSSGTGSLTWSTGPNPQFDHRRMAGGMAAYRSSKTAVNALTVFYAQALAADGIKVNALAPGLRATNLNPQAARSDGDPAEAAAAAVRLATLADDGPSGEFFSWDGSRAAW